jgi:hypothetical protein
MRVLVRGELPAELHAPIVSTAAVRVSAAP